MNASEEELQKKRHSLAHLLGATLLDLYPGTKLAIGPAIDNGFYYDAEMPESLSADDLPNIEKKMREMAKEWKTFEKKTVTKEEALEHFKENPYKTELIEEFSKDGKELTFYTIGSFTDLCAGGHIDKIDGIALDGFTLSRVAGAYWRGNEKNTMLTRIYGLAFNTKKELDEYKKKIEEAKERDHRKIGKELGLFSFSPLVGPGLPLFTPKGTALRRALESMIEKLLDKYRYERVWVPHITKSDLYKTSGHWEKFGDELLKVTGKTDEFVLKPMNCPHHMQIYASSMKSYADLPVRYAENTTVYRDEQKGELLGLTRVLSLTQDDGHIFCTEEQIEQEIASIIALVKEFYTELGFFKEGAYEVFLSVRGDDKEKYLGDDETWDSAEKAMKKVLEQENMSFTREPGEAAFYGPKIDFLFKDSAGRKWQLSTIQIDFVMPKRFNLTYVDRDGKKKTPVVIHRAISGAFERFLGILIEHFAGNFPFFLAPVQVRVLPISENEHSYAKTTHEKLTQNNIRADIDMSAETIGKKIAKMLSEKIPARMVIGKKEVKDGTVTLEMEGKKEVVSVDECLRILKEKNTVFADTE